MSFVPDISNIVRYGSAFPPQRLGVARASTFTGFCSKHDDSIFAPLEKRPFTGTAEQCFLLAYRALARELHLKRATLAYFETCLHETQHVHGAPPPVAGFSLNGFLNGTRKGMADMTSHKDDYDSVLIAKDYRRVRAFVIEMPEPPAVMCSGGIVPEHTFLGEKMVDIANHRGRLHLLSFSSFADATGGFVVFAWLDDRSNYSERLVQSLQLLPANALTSSLIRFFFECCENIHIGPSWWQSLSASVQDSLIARMDGSSEFAPRDRARNFYSDNGLRYGDWQVNRSYEIGP